MKVASAFIVTFIVTMYVQVNQPYSTVQLNNMAVFSFVGAYTSAFWRVHMQPTKGVYHSPFLTHAHTPGTLATLFYGLLAMANDGDPDIDPDGIDQTLMRYLVMFINMFVVALPFVEMEGLGKIPFAIISGVVCCLGPICIVLGLKKKEVDDVVAEPGDPYNSDDELVDMHADDPYHAAYSAVRRKEIQAIFDKIDSNQNGTVSRDELFAGLTRSGYTSDRVDEIFEAIDADGSLEISREEFENYFLGRSSEKQENSQSTCQSRQENPGRGLEGWGGVGRGREGGPAVKSEMIFAAGPVSQDSNRFCQVPPQSPLEFSERAPSHVISPPPLTSELVFAQSSSSSTSSKLPHAYEDEDRVVQLPRGGLPVTDMNSDQASKTQSPFSMFSFLSTVWRTDPEPPKQNDELAI